ncbi:hypothetical protein JCM13664_01400 [Methylothermus subterraneus]
MGRFEEKTPIRLQAEQVRCIRQAVAETFGERARGYLFGSRTDPTARGFDLTEEDWMQLRGLRNAIAHEYPDSAHEIAQAVNELYRWLPKVRGWLKRMQVFSRESW